MGSEFSLPQLASRLGLDCAGTDEASTLSLRRHGCAVDVAADIAAHLDPSTPLGRHLAWGVFFGIRLAIDHQNHDFDPAEERQGAEALYGGRLPRLVNTVTMSWFEALSGAPLFTSDWLFDSLKLAYLYESGKVVHALSLGDIGQMPISAEKIAKDGRHALFYDSFKRKPVQKITEPEGLIRVFTSSEGLGATRALLLPDFDYDAAREGGCFAIPSRDTMIIGRPRECEGAPALRQKVDALAAQMYRDAPYPLSTTVFDMTPKTAFAGPNPALNAALAAPLLHDLPSYKDGVKAVQAPAGVHIYSSNMG
ncbi:hypothetical protein [Bradymonas sediminis]|uniref:Uncharacterized protein n=1 Tax=Bradymonas sediminis TaxID=1548548 RepID=A0A2Z4FK79_9DELT|nr:hypothetical protein [Bradymonas sediminis]AWV89126.1 hypothetical protein DN745_07165 [Bradymonas sediminis]TDP64408.1 hypothetical protein DFR33_10969 [Bradymonas sediminis]